MKRVKGLTNFLLVVVLLMSTVFNGSLVFAAQNNNIIAAKGTGIVILKGDGTVAVGGNNNVNQYDARNWTNIKSVYKYLTDIYGLTNDGKVKFTARDKKSEILESWTDVVMLSVKNHIMGLKSDGTVYNTYAYDGTENWRNIIMITQGLGLKSDGTIEIIKSLNGTKYANEIKTWNGIVKIIAFDDCDNGAIGVKNDGTLIYTGRYFDNDASLREIANWKDIVDIDVAASNHIVGLTKDGNILVAGKSYLEGKLKNPADFSKFTNIKAISAAEYFVVGLKNDGSIVAAGSTWSGKDDISLYIDSLNYSVGEASATQSTVTQTPVAQPTPTPQPINNIALEINGQRVNFSDQQPIIKDGRTLVAVRGVFETLGYTVSWEQSTQTATLTNGVNTVIIMVGKSTFTTNGNTYSLDVPAQIINGRTMLPFRAVLESVGCSVDWNGSSNTAIVSSGNSNSNVAANSTLQPTPQAPQATVSDAELEIIRGGLNIIKSHFNAVSSIVNDKSLQMGNIDGYNPDTMKKAGDIPEGIRDSVIQEIHKDNVNRVFAISNAAIAIAEAQKGLIKVETELKLTLSGVNASDKLKSFVDLFSIYVNNSNNLLAPLMDIATDTTKASGDGRIVNNAVELAQRRLTLMEQTLSAMENLVK